MFHLIVVLYISTGFSTASDSTQDVSSYNNARKIKATQGMLGFHPSFNNNPTPSHVVFFEKDENQVRIPTKIYDEHKKKKKIKKSPKRTIQKIIKKGKNRSRKIYVNPITRLPTVTSVRVKMIDVSDQNEDATTGNPRRRLRKNSKVARYPMPFHKFQSKKDTHHRNRRDEKDEFYILKDFDDMEFLDKGKDYNIVKTQVKKYW